MKFRLIEIEKRHCRNGMQQLVVRAGGSLHLADYESGRFVVARGRQAITMRADEVEKVLVDATWDDI